ncbi:ComF family protein [Actinotalea subterranea]|uniref:ComF family protein n=1 Tax=Actinotalea subterranea TaxID=2607497 RepID=UPI0011EE9283|nr:phosphoribosyltransferase family protein [Actinotalea subterranea]
MRDDHGQPDARGVVGVGGHGRLGHLGGRLRDVGRLVLPVECPGCGLWDVVLCAACAGVLDAPVDRFEQHVPRLDRMDGTAPLPVWAVAPYTGPVRGVVVAWKDRGRADLGRHLLRTAARMGAEVAPDVRAALGTQTLHVVPVPSAPGARRRRGADLVRGLAGAVADGLASQGVSARLAPVLVQRRGGRDQVGLGARARGRNTTDRIRLRTGPVRRPAPAGRWHLLVDDVVTTGSTLAAAGEVLSRNGGFVLAAVVLAATPPPARPPVGFS